MATDMFLALDGIRGESLDKIHQGKIDVLDWRWGARNIGKFHYGSGGGMGKADFKNFVIRKYIDRATCDLMYHAASGKRIKTGLLILRKSGGVPLEYLKFQLDNISVVSIKTGLVSEPFTETVTLSFSAIEAEYKYQDARGASRAGGMFTWNPVSFEPAHDFEPGQLFHFCRNPVRGLSEADFTGAAASLEVEVATIKAVAEVESPGGAFDDQGRPTILFERHYFDRLTHGHFREKSPDISNLLGGGYGSLAGQYSKLERAYTLAPVAALKSASWGRFQIMGANYAAAGYGGVYEFVQAMASSESEHLRAFVAFLRSDKRQIDALKSKDWGAFAQLYNGVQYKKNNYDQKLAVAYAKYAGAK